MKGEEAAPENVLMIKKISVYRATIRTVINNIRHHHWNDHRPLALMGSMESAVDQVWFHLPCEKKKQKKQLYCNSKVI